LLEVMFFKRLSISNGVDLFFSMTSILALLYSSSRLVKPFNREVHFSVASYLLSISLRSITAGLGKYAGPGFSLDLTRNMFHDFSYGKDGVNQLKSASSTTFVQKMRGFDQDTVIFMLRWLHRQACYTGWYNRIVVSTWWKLYFFRPYLATHVFDYTSQNYTTKFHLNKFLMLLNDTHIFVKLVVKVSISTRKTIVPHPHAMGSE
jgi:hypothetical protein